jgi:hypothetical protein
MTGCCVVSGLLMIAFAGPMIPTSGATPVTFDAPDWFLTRMSPAEIAIRASF